MIVAEVVERDDPSFGAATTDFDRPVHCLLGLPFDALSLREAVATIRSAGAHKRRCFLTTPNLNYVIACRTDVLLRGSVLQSDLSVPDGMPLLWVARLLGIPLRERVAGSSVVDALRRPDGRPLSVFFFGGPDGVAATACEALNRAPGGLTCAGFCSPGYLSVPEMSTSEMLSKIDRANADFLIVALPAKKGQTWILDNLPRIAAPVIANLGAVINFVAGTVSRAPTRWQRLGLEWLWRIRQEPTLWRRYLGDGSAFVGLLLTKVLPTMIGARLAKPIADQLGSTRVSVALEASLARIVLAGAWTADNVGPFRNACRQATEAPSDIEVDLGSVSFVDSACIGLLLLLRGHQQKTGRRLSLVSAPETIRKQLARCGAGYLLEV